MDDRAAAGAAQAEPGRPVAFMIRATRLWFTTSPFSRSPAVIPGTSQGPSEARWTVRIRAAGFTSTARRAALTAAALHQWQQLERAMPRRVHSRFTPWRRRWPATNCQAVHQRAPSPGGIPGALAQDPAFLRRPADLLAQGGVLRLQRCGPLGGCLRAAPPGPVRSGRPGPVPQSPGVDARIGGDLPDHRPGPRPVQHDRVRLALRRTVLRAHETSVPGVPGSGGLVRPGPEAKARSRKQGRCPFLAGPTTGQEGSLNRAPGRGGPMPRRGCGAAAAHPVPRRSPARRDPGGAGRRRPLPVPSR
ncbi:hypothetical protein SGRIM128S_03125 [Streptomyces griseomycini]